MGKKSFKVKALRLKHFTFSKTRYQSIFHHITRPRALNIRLFEKSKLHLLFAVSVKLA